MATLALENQLDVALDRIEHALARLEAVVAAAPRSAGDPGELAALRTRHRKLKDTVTQELQQLDLLLANLPQ
jgi:50S ribosomal subunit-associated GTPase HflX